MDRRKRERERTRLVRRENPVVLAELLLVVLLALRAVVDDDAPVAVLDLLLNLGLRAWREVASARIERKEEEEESAPSTAREERGARRRGSSSPSGRSTH